MVAIMANHISQLTDKTARAILGQALIDDSYHDNIMVAAGELVAYVWYSNHRYIGQWSSGSTLWYPPDGSPMSSIIVDRYGRIA